VRRRLDQTHRWSHAHVHLTKVDEDRHQHEGVQHQMVKLEIIVLQQREKEGGRWECEPGQGVGGKLDDFTGPQATKQNGSTPYHPIVLHCLPSKQPPHPHDVAIRPKMGVGRLDTIAVCGGLALRDGGELECKGRRRRV
jgi:hypothetical protein